MLRSICFRNFKSSCFTQLKKTQKELFHHRNQNFRKNFGRSSNSSKLSPNKSTIFERMNIDNNTVIPPGNLTKAVIFTLSFSAGTFIGVSIWEYERLRSIFLEKRQSSNFTWFKAKVERKQNKSELQNEVEKWWNNLSQGEQVFVPIFILNAIVFGLWRIPRLQPIMMTYFCSNPAAKIVCWPMILSTFSHVSLFHIFANMFVLHSFISPAVQSLGKEQFLGVYLSAGVISTLCSYLYKATTFQSGFSLGASGAIMAILSYVCTAYPDTKLSILFLPMFTFSAGTAIKFIIALDFAGCLLMWKFFDHAAHLGGAAFGIFWYFIGQHSIWPERRNLQKYWNEIRTSK